MMGVKTNLIGGEYSNFQVEESDWIKSSLFDGLLLWSPMNSKWSLTSSTLVDRSKTNLPLAINGNPVLGSDYITFDATGDYIVGTDSTTNYFSFSNTGNFSLSAMIKTSSLSGLIFHRRSTTGYAMQLWSNTLRGGIDFFIDDVVGNKNFQCTTSAISDNVWHQIVCVFDKDAANKRAVYVDNIPQSGSGTSTIGDFAQAGQNLGIGGTAAGGGLWAGSMCNAMIWNRALSTNDISSLYNYFQKLNLV